MSFRWSDSEVRVGDMASLRRTPTVLAEILSDRPEAWLDAHHDEGCLSPRETVGHLIYSETDNWMPRLRHILDVGEGAPFPPLDLHGGDRYVETLTVEAMLDRFAVLREERVLELEELNLTEADLGKSSIHPAFGVVTLDQLASTWVAHDLYHCGQIFKAFASGFQPSIGPWQAFLNLPHFH